MLKMISCDKFIEHGKIREPIVFHHGLNAILGTDEGNNSIGKSTFLMILDFIFGGDDYMTKSIPQRYIGNHEFRFIFEFDDGEHYFIRSTSSYTQVAVCDNLFNMLKMISTNEYCSILAKYYNIPDQNLTFRNFIANFFRVYQRETTDENKPLQKAKKQPDKEAITTLIKSFEKYDEIEEAKNYYEEAEEDLSIFRSAKDKKLIPIVGTQTAYKENEVQISNLKTELKVIEDNSSNGLDDLNSVQVQMLQELRDHLLTLQRSRIHLVNRKRAIENDAADATPKFQHDFEELKVFFPDIDLAKLTDIEKFHVKLSDILKNERVTQLRKLSASIMEIEKQIKILNDDITSFASQKNATVAVLKKYASITQQIDLLSKANDNYNELTKRKDERNRRKDAYDALIDAVIKEIQSKINHKLRELNDSIYGGIKNSPVLTITNSKCYEFNTPNDNGTGTNYKGLILFDLAMLELTAIPVIVHDSFLLKQIEDKAVEKLLELYAKSEKQIFITLDRSKSYTKRSQELLIDNCVLTLQPGGGELFGKAWNEIPPENPTIPSESL